MTVIRHLLSSGAKVNQAREVVSSFLYHIRDILGAHTASRMQSQVHVLYNVVLFQEDNIYVIISMIYMLCHDSSTNFSFFWLYNKQAIFLIYFNFSGFVVSHDSQGRDLVGFLFII